MSTKSLRKRKNSPKEDDLRDIRPLSSQIDPRRKFKCTRLDTVSASPSSTGVPRLLRSFLHRGVSITDEHLVWIHDDQTCAAEPGARQVMTKPSMQQRKQRVIVWIDGDRCCRSRSDGCRRRDELDQVMHRPGVLLFSRRPCGCHYGAILNMVDIGFSSCFCDFVVLRPLGTVGLAKDKSLA